MLNGYAQGIQSDFRQPLRASGPRHCARATLACLFFHAEGAVDGRGALAFPCPFFFARIARQLFQPSPVGGE